MKKVFFIIFLIFGTIPTFSSEVKNVKIMVPKDLDISTIENSGYSDTLRSEKNDIVLLGVASEGSIEKIKAYKGEENAYYQYLEVEVTHSNNNADVKLALSYLSPDTDSYVVIADGNTTESDVDALKTKYEDSTDDLIGLDESSYNFNDFFGIKLKDNAVVSGLRVGDEELFSLTRTDPSNILAKFTEDGEANFGTGIPVLETEDDSFYIKDKDGGLWIAQDNYFDRTDAQLAKIPAEDTIIEKYDKPGSNYSKIDDYNNLGTGDPGTLDFYTQPGSSNGYYDYYFYSGEATEVFFKIDKDYEKDTYNGEYEPPEIEGATLVTLKQYEAYIYRPEDGYIITLFTENKANAKHSNSGGFWSIGIVKKSELYSGEEKVVVLGGIQTTYEEKTSIISSSENSLRERKTNVELGEHNGKMEVSIEE